MLPLCRRWEPSSSARSSLSVLLVSVCAVAANTTPPVIRIGPPYRRTCHLVLPFALRYPAAIRHMSEAVKTYSLAGTVSPMIPVLVCALAIFLLSGMDAADEDLGYRRGRLQYGAVA